MSPEVAAALEASIEHWKQNAKAKKLKNAHIFSESCPLCNLFLDDDGKKCDSANLGSCPIKARTGSNLCNRTPWVDCRDTFMEWTYSRKSASLSKKFRADALRMVAFLESLREPEGGA